MLTSQLLRKKRNAWYFHWDIGRKLCCYRLFVVNTQVSSKKSEIAMQVLEKGIDLSNTRFSCLDSTNSVSG